MAPVVVAVTTRAGPHLAAAWRAAGPTAEHVELPVVVLACSVVRRPRPSPVALL